MVLTFTFCVFSLLHFVYAAYHVKGTFTFPVVLAVENFGETTDGVYKRDVFTFAAGELFGYKEGLGKKPLKLTGAGDYEFVFITKFIYSKDGDDVLKVFISLEDFFNSTGDPVVFLANDFRCENS